MQNFELEHLGAHYNHILRTKPLQNRFVFLSHSQGHCIHMPFFPDEFNFRCAATHDRVEKKMYYKPDAAGCRWVEQDAE